MPTVTADSVEIGNMPMNLTVKIHSGDIDNAVDVIHLKINNTPTLRTNKMIMYRNVRVKMVNTVAHTKPLYLSHICKKGSIAVYRAKADIRIFLPDIHIDNISSRMILAAHQKIFNDLSLPAIF